MINDYKLRGCLIIMCACQKQRKDTYLLTLYAIGLEAVKQTAMRRRLQNNGPHFRRIFGLSFYQINCVCVDLRLFCRFGDRYFWEGFVRYSIWIAGILIRSSSATTFRSFKSEFEDDPFFRYDLNCVAWNSDSVSEFCVDVQSTYAAIFMSSGGLRKFLFRKCIASFI